MSGIELPRRTALRGVAALFGAGAFTALTASPGLAESGLDAEDGQHGTDGVDPWGLFRNLPWSKKSILVATGINGGGIITRVYPGGVSPFDTDSFLVQYTPGSGYITRVNGVNYEYKGWVNCAWRLRIEANIMLEEGYDP